METTYTMIGVDGQQYGPISLEQMRGWIGEGRVTRETQVLRNDVNSWLPAAQYVELGLAQPAQAVAAGSPPRFGSTPAGMDAALDRRVKSSAGWFFLIGGLSLVNSLAAMSGSNWRFLVGLGITDVITAFASTLGGSGMVVGLLLNLFVLAVFVLFGVFARKGHSWSFIAGMVCYAGDGVLLLLFEADTMNIVFHGLALVFMFLGLRANMKLKAMQRAIAA